MEKLAKSRRKIEKPRPIARRRHNYLFLLLAILFGIISYYLVFHFPPNYIFPVGNFGIPILPIFFMTFGLFIFSAFTFIFIQKIQGVIFSLFILCYLILRLTGLTHFIFGFMFIALFITVELFILKKK